MTRLRLALAALLLLVGVSGCAAIRAVTETEDALVDAGFTDATVGWSSEDGVEYVDVYWNARATTAEALTRESLSAAEVIWRVAPVRFDIVRTDPYVEFSEDRFNVVRTFPREQLEQQLGPRPARLDRSVGDLLNAQHYLRWAVGGSVAFFASAILIVLLVLRSSRRDRAAAA